MSWAESGAGVGVGGGAGGGLWDQARAEVGESLELDDLLRRVVDLGGSDLHLTIGVPPTIRVRGEMRAVEGFEALEARPLQQAAKDAGAMAEIIAPHVAGAKLSDGNMMEADEKIDGGPSVVYDAVAVVMGEDSGKRYAEDKPSIDFVNDAFAHAKFVAYVPAVQPLFENAGVWSRRDDGFFDVSSGKDAAASFIETCGKLRFWDRESVKQD